MQMHDGHLFTTGFDGGNSMVFSVRENANRVLFERSNKESTPKGVLSLFIKELQEYQSAPADESGFGFLLYIIF